MSVLHIALPPETAPRDDRRVAALVYPDEMYPDLTFRRIVEACRVGGLALAGVLQHRAFEDCDHNCDVILEDLASGGLIKLFEDRGEGASGCRLDMAALAEATAGIERSLLGRPDLLVLNKFGKAEAMGEGLRDLIAEAIDRDIPVIIGVPSRNLEAWRDFAGGLSTELPADADRVIAWREGLERGGSQHRLDRASS